MQSQITKLTEELETTKVDHSQAQKVSEVNLKRVQELESQLESVKKENDEVMSQMKSK